jgi:hypothetical protein
MCPDSHHIRATWVPFSGSNEGSVITQAAKLA